MSCLGMHFAIEPQVMARLLTAPDDEARLSVISGIEESNDYDGWSHDSDKSWDALHRCLTNGRLEWGSDAAPLSQAVLAGPNLYEGDDYIICLLRPELTAAVAESLSRVTEEEMRNRYYRIPTADYGVELTEDDFRYTWENFPDLPDLFAKASRAGRAVIFTVDQ